MIPQTRPLRKDDISVEEFLANKRKAQAAATIIEVTQLADQLGLGVIVRWNTQRDLHSVQLSELFFKPGMRLDIFLDDLTETDKHFIGAQEHMLSRVNYH